MKKTKLAVFAALLISSVILLTGCVRYKAELEITPKGTMNFSLLYAMNTSMLAEQGLSLSGKDDEGLLSDEQIAEYKQNGFEVAEYNQDNYKGVIISKENFDPNQERKKAGAGSSSVETIDKQIHFDKTENGNYRIEIMLNDLYGGEDSSSSSMAADTIRKMDGYMEATVKLPCKAVASNATRTEGQTLTWDLLSLNDNSIYVELESSFWITMFLARYGWMLAAGLVLILVIISVSIIAVKVKKRKPNETQTF